MLIAEAKNAIRAYAFLGRQACVQLAAQDCNCAPTRHRGSLTTGRRRELRNDIFGAALDMDEPQVGKESKQCVKSLRDLRRAHDPANRAGSWRSQRGHTVPDVREQRGELFLDHPEHRDEFLRGSGAHERSQLRVLPEAPGKRRRAGERSADDNKCRLGRRERQVRLASEPGRYGGDRHSAA